MEQTSTECYVCDYKILGYIPNIIGYVRLSLLFGSFCNFSSAVLFISLYSLSISLDFIDGYTARKFNQCSAFGAWFDVVIDNIGRGLLWVHIHPMLYLITAIEWLSYVCNHQLGDKWKDSLTSEQYQPPYFVSKVLHNNFRNLWGILAISGLHVLPIWLMGIQKEVFQLHLSFLPDWLPLAGVCILTLGRLLCMMVEIWSIWSHIQLLLLKSTASR